MPGAASVYVSPALTDDVMIMLYHRDLLMYIKR